MAPSIIICSVVLTICNSKLLFIFWAEQKKPVVHMIKLKKYFKAGEVVLKINAEIKKMFLVLRYYLMEIPVSI